jgi:hypothetical protein
MFNAVEPTCCEHKKVCFHLRVWTCATLAGLPIFRCIAPLKIEKNFNSQKSHFLRLDKIFIIINPHLKFHCNALTKSPLASPHICLQIINHQLSCLGAGILGQQDSTAIVSHRKADSGAIGAPFIRILFS